MHITIYSTSTCSYCLALKGWLDNKGMVYEYKLTDEDDSAMDEFMAVNEGVLSVPFTVITKDDGSEIKINGFNQHKLEQALAL